MSKERSKEESCDHVLPGSPRTPIGPVFCQGILDHEAEHFAKQSETIIKDQYGTKMRIVLTESVYWE